MAKRCFFWMAVFLIGGLFELSIAEPAELPREVTVLIDAYESDVQALRKSFTAELNEWRESLVKELKVVQRELADKEQLDEAILVRNLVRSFEAEKESDSTAPVPSEQFQKLPREAQKLLLARESPGSAKSRLEKEGAVKLAALLKSLSEQQAKFTKDEKLDEAVAIRDWIRRNAPGGQLPQPRKKVSIEVMEITRGAKDLTQIQQNYQVVATQLGQRYQQEVADSSEWLVEQLKASQSTHTKAGRLDEALEIRKLIESLTMEKSVLQHGPLMNKHRVKLPDDAVRLVDHFLRTAANAQSELTERMKALDSQLIKPTEEAARKALLGQDLEAARRAVGAVYSAKREHVAFHFHVHRQPLKVAPPTSEILDELAKGNANRLAKLEEIEAPLRKALLEKLGKRSDSNLKAEEELAIRRTTESLTASNFKGLRGYLLFNVDTELQGESALLAQNYLQEMGTQVDSMRAEFLAAHKELKPRLEAARRVHVEAGDWAAALADCEQLQSPPTFFEPISVKCNSHIGHNQFPWDVTLIDVRDGAYLVNNMHRREEWMTRDRLRLGNETFPELKARRFGDFSVPPPSFPVTMKTLLKQGRIVLFQENTQWNLGEIKEVRTNEAVVRLLGYGIPRDSVVRRTELRTLVPFE